MELGERKQKILCAIIEDYIRTGEPVGSKVLAQQLDNAVSSATIRNEMAELCSLGYLEQPHTSAGRVPTASAFRLYIDKLMKCRPLPEESQRDIDAVLEKSAGDPEQLMERASEVLSEATGYAAVTTTPMKEGACVRRVALMPVSSRAVALLLMTSSGVLRSRVCRLPQDIGGETLEQIGSALTAAFVGMPLSSIGLPDVQGLLLSLGENGLLSAPLLTAFLELVQASAEAEVLLSGQLNLLRHPDYAPENARSLLGFLSQREQLVGMLTAHTGGLRVVLGSESLRPELNGSSLIVTRYIPRAGDTGAIGLIGPQRMDYAAAISRLEYVAKAVGRMLGRILEEDGD